MNRSVWTWVAVGIAVPVAVGCWFLYQRGGATPTEVGAAQYVGVAPRLYHEMDEITTRAEQTHRISDADWNFLKSSNETRRFRQMSLMPLVYANARFSHRAAAIIMLKQFLSTQGEKGRIPEIMALRSLGDPSWKAEAQQLFGAKDKETARLAHEVFDKSLSEGSGAMK